MRRLRLLYAVGPRAGRGYVLAKPGRSGAEPRRLRPRRARRLLPGGVRAARRREWSARAARGACRSVELQRAHLLVEHGRDVDEPRRQERRAHPRRRPVGAGRDLVGAEVADAAARHGPQRRRGGAKRRLVVDVEVAAVADVDRARLHLVHRALDHADEVAERNRVAAVFGKAGKARRLGAENLRDLRGRLPALAVVAGAVPAQNEDVHRAARCRVPGDGAAAAQDLVEAVRCHDEDGCGVHGACLRRRRSR